ncbi:copper chaperone PCu(A)C [Photobacterium sp. CCB-ST2H9]|uniref:copper chaperone PCu(A)C n=1 Tax=Photobacterium sp. CCB-ST2H9 TaxID=2912855 RepID=UPI00200315CC|nr:copper chaperone PCu(A)C [Photobacterium sp. CCB-ST2H9]UTM59279.1 copper chaperone PCu(A)C [Photobacterium sp. CCB-ST2H9]
MKTENTVKIMKTLLLAASVFTAGLAQAHEFKAGQLHIEHPWSKEVPPMSSVAAAFFSIENHGDENDVLLRAESPIAEKVELHEHAHENGMMKMRQVADIQVPAHDTQLLQPGGYHVMMFNLKSVPKLGERFPLTLYFKHAGKVDVEVKVEKADYQMGSNQPMEHHNMDHEGMDHDHMEDGDMGHDEMNHSHMDHDDMHDNMN